MGKRKRVYCKRVWEHQDEIELLAYLDFTLKHQLDFDSTVIGHLAAVTGKQFSDSQIKSKLKREWEYHGRLGGVPGSVQDLLTEGSSFLVEWTASDHEEVRQALERLSPPVSRYHLRSTPLMTVSASRTLSRSATRQSSESSPLSVHATPEFEGWEDTQLSQASGATSSSLVQVAPTLNHSDSPSVPATVKTEEPGPPAHVLSVPSAQTADAASQTTPSPPPRHEAISHALATSSAELETARRQVAEQQGCIFTLKNRLAAAETERQEIWKSARAAAYHRDDMEMQRRLRLENSSLKDQIDKIEKQRQSVARVEAGVLGPSDNEIRREFEQILGDVGDACGSVADVGIFRDPAAVPDAGGVIGSWARRLVHGDGLGPLVSLALDGEAKDEVFKSVAAAGLCSLVFESRFPDFAARESPLLDQYRKHVLARVGPKLLSQLDLLAFESLIAEDHFSSHVVEEKARTLAGELTDALRWFLPPDDQTVSDQRDAAVAEVFVDVFVRALKLKARLVLSGKRYQLTFFAVGDGFDPKTMVRDGDTYNNLLPGRKRTRTGLPRQREIGDKIYERAPVRLCLFPALYCAGEEEQDRSDTIGTTFMDCLVNTANFLTGDADALEPSCRVVVKAVVLV